MAFFPFLIVRAADFYITSCKHDQSLCCYSKFLCGVRNFESFFRTQRSEVRTAIMVPSMDNSGNYFAIRYKNNNKYSQFEFELTRNPRKTHCEKIKIGPI